MVQAFVLLAFVQSKIWSRHLSSWHLSNPKYGQGICPPGICLNRNMVQAFDLLAFVQTKNGSMHLSSWYLSDPKYGQGICPPGICLNQNMVQGFVLLAFVRTKSGSRHLSDPKVGPGICPPGICPIQKLVLEFVLRDIRPVLVFFLQGICQGRKMPGPGICLLAMYWDWLHSLIKSKDNYVKVFDTYSPIFGRTNARS